MFNCRLLPSMISPVCLVKGKVLYIGYASFGLVAFAAVIPVQPVNIIGSVETPVRNMKDTAILKVRLYLAEDGAHMDFLRFIPWKEIIGNGNPVLIQKQSSLRFL